MDLNDCIQFMGQSRDIFQGVPVNAVSGMGAKANIDAGMSTQVVTKRQPFLKALFAAPGPCGFNAYDRKNELGSQAHCIDTLRRYVRKEVLIAECGGSSEKQIYESEICSISDKFLRNQ